MISKHINRIYRYGNAYRGGQLKSVELGGMSQTYLMIIAHHPGCTQDSLANKMMVNKSNVTRRMKRLEDEGYIYRQVNEDDRRSFFIFPTQKTIDLLPEMGEIKRRWDEILMASLNEEERAMFNTLLRRIEQHAKGEIE